MTSNKLVSPIDPFDSSVDYLLILIFTKSSSVNFTLALSIAEGASKFASVDINGKPTYFVRFSKNNADAGRAITLIDLTKDWKGLQMFARGRLLTNIYMVTQVMNCYINSLSCNDYTAHCFEIVDDPDYQKNRRYDRSLSIVLSSKPQLKRKIEIGRFSFPCKMLHFHFRFQDNHPASIIDQIQAGAVGFGCDWCPHFEPQKWKKVGVKEVEIDAFD